MSTLCRVQHRNPAYGGAPHHRPLFTSESRHRVLILRHAVYRVSDLVIKPKADCHVAALNAPHASSRKDGKKQGRGRPSTQCATNSELSLILSFRLPCPDEVVGANVVSKRGNLLFFFFRHCERPKGARQSAFHRLTSVTSG